MSLRDTRRHMKRNAVERQRLLATRNSQLATRNSQLFEAGQVVKGAPGLSAFPWRCVNVSARGFTEEGHADGAEEDLQVQ